MEIVKECGTAILSTIVEDLVKSTGRQVGYIFRFKSIIEDMKKEAENLRSKQEHMQHRVDRAIKDTEEIEEDVQKWLRDVGAVVADVQNLENESREKQTCLNCTWKYQLARRAEKKKSIILKLRDSGNFDIISHRAPLSSINVFSPKDNFMPFESNLRSFDQVLEALKDDKINMVGLYGMGGVGKTTLAKKVVNKSMEEKIFNRVVMVVVSQTPNIKNIQGQIADLLHFKLDEESTEGRAERLSMRLKNEKKILIILDDIWAKLDLTHIGIPMDDHHKDCKIFLTTRQQRVCIDMGCQLRIPLNVLSEEEGLLLFKRQVGLNDDSPTLINSAKEVAKECKGLPLAIVTIGSVLKENATDEWKRVIQKLKNSKLMDVDETVYACLKLSYDYLKNEKTKSCFLLCSLFPEDHEIDMEQLVRYGLGLGLYQDIDLVEDARSELRAMVNSLKASSLLLDAREGYVKMHDVVRDVALSITSKGKDVFMVKAGMGLTEWPEHEGLEQCKAISLIENEIDVLPNGLVCPKLNILLLGSKYYSIEVSEEFFAKMKALKVLSLERGELSLNSLQSLTNLVTLHLINCELRDISALKTLTKLEILNLHGSKFVELLEELGELSKLRMLDVSQCHYLERVPANVLSKLSRLEELYIAGNFSRISPGIAGLEGISAESNIASLSELSKLHRLTILALSILFHECLPKDFILLTKLLKYEIKVNAFYLHPVNTDLTSRRLKIRKIEATSLFAFKALYENVEYLELQEIWGCYPNIVPSIDETGLNELKSLSLKDIYEMECIIDMTQQHVPSTAFSNLETLEIENCKSMSCIFPKMSIQKLGKLKKVTIRRCKELQEVFQLEGLYYTNENPFPLSSLTNLDLRVLPNMRHIWKGPTQQVSLQSLTVVGVYNCNELRYLFTLTLARSLLQLQELRVKNCDSLEHIVAIKAEEAEENVAAGGGTDVVLPKLRTLNLYGLPKMTNLCSENYSLTWPALQKLILNTSSNWTLSFVSELEARMQTANENLRVLRVERSNELCNVVPACLKNGFQNLESLTISHCTQVLVIFQLEGLEQVLSLTSLKYLKFENLKKLECLCKGPTHLLSLPNLKTLSVGDCNRLRHLFSSSLARNLPQLENIYIRDCRELEQIIVEDHTEDNDAHMTVDRQIVLPQLHRLDLQRLESLVNFCPSGYHLIFPSLSYLTVRICPKLTARFSVEENGTVHAEAEAPHTDKEDVDMEQSPRETTSLSDREIRCWGSDALRKGLPAYIGK